MKTIASALAVITLLASASAFACISAVSKEEIYTVNIPGTKVVTLNVNAEGVSSSILKIRRAVKEGPEVAYDHDVLSSVSEEDGTLALIPAKIGVYDTVVVVTYGEAKPVVQNVHVNFRVGNKCMAAD